MTELATTLQAFFTDRLVRQRQVSANTIQAYRDTLRLLLVFASERQGKSPVRLDIDDLDSVSYTHLEVYKRQAHVRMPLAGGCAMSHLRKVLADYLSMRRALGYKMDQVERRLRQFIAFAEDHGETHVRTLSLIHI